MSETRPPAVSVIVPSYNYARFLPAAIGSVAGQTFGDWECIVIDDGSTDETWDVLSRLTQEDGRVHAERQPRLGVAAARNRGLAVAKGRYIQFLDADDLLAPHKLTEQVSVLEAESDVDVVHGPTAYFENEPLDPGQVRATGPGGSSLGPADGAAFLERLVLANVMTVEAPLVRRSVLGKIGGFDVGMRRLEDWDLWLRTAMAGARVTYRPSETPMAFVRLHGESLSQVGPAAFFPDLARMRRRAGPALPTPLRALNRRMLIDAQAGAGIQIGVGGRPWAGLRLLLASVVAEPRPLWLAWTVALAVMTIPGGRRLIDLIRGRPRARVPR